MTKKAGPTRPKPAAPKGKAASKPAKPIDAASKVAPKAKAAKSAVKASAKPVGPEKSSAAVKVPPAKTGKPAPAKTELKGTKALAPEKPVKAGSKAESAKPVAKPTSGKPAASKPAAPAKVEPPKAGGKGAAVATPPAAAPGVPPRKGITIVTPKRPRPPKPKPSTSYVSSPGGLSRTVFPRKPLIPSGPNAASRAVLDHADPNAKRKSPFNKSQLDKFRKILQVKRAELAGEVTGLENEALRGSSGSLSHTPSHMAEQGTETADQSLSLDLAAQERKLIREIDEAIKRIDDGVFGLCELTGKPIPPDRLEELPWTRYSIDAARELERRSYQR